MSSNYFRQVSPKSLRAFAKRKGVPVQEVNRYGNPCQDYQRPVALKATDGVQVRKAWLDA